MQFRNRQEAGEKLATILAPIVKNQPGIIYGLARGGVVVACEVARRLHLPIEVLIPRKIGAPTHPEFAVGAVSERGHSIKNEQVEMPIDPDWFSTEVKNQLRIIRKRRAFYAPNGPVSSKNKIAIIVDDGVATGLTMQAAIADIRDDSPLKIIVSVPVIPVDIKELLQKQVDAVVAFEIPTEHYHAVGEYYDEFPQVVDEDVVRMIGSTGV